MTSVNWRLARSLTGLRTEVNGRWTQRSKTSDGTIGNAEHAARPSDHNRNAAGVVRAIDITASGIDAAWYAEHLRRLGSAGHPALRNGGVIIYNRRITSSARGWTWRTYTGSNPHQSHIHCSVSKDPHCYDDTTPWGIANHEEPFMPALTHDEQRELLDRMRRIEGAVHGVDDKTRPTSIWWRVNYLAGEVIEGGNNLKLRKIFAKHGA